MEALINIDINELVKYKNNHTLKETGEYFGVSSPVIVRKLKEINYKELSPLEKFELAINDNNFINYFKNNNDYSNICEYFNVSQSVINKRIKKLNLKVKINYNKKEKPVYNDLKELNNEEFIKYYSCHNSEDTCKYFNTTMYHLNNKIKNIGYVKDAQLNIQKFNNIPDNEIIEYYNTHNMKETGKYFNVGTETIRQRLIKIGHIKEYDKIKSLRLERQKSTTFEKYGVNWSCQTDSCIDAYFKAGYDSKPNKEFEELLKKNNIEYTREFNIGNNRYDFKIGNILVEINPSSTHNSTFVPFNNGVKDKNYHQNKTKLANENNYRCIHV